MTDKKTDDHVVDGEVVIADTEKQKTPNVNSQKSSNIGLTVLLLAAIGGGVGAGFWGWQLLQQQKSNTAQLQQQIQRQHAKLSSFSQVIAAVKADEQTELNAVKQQLLATQQRLDSQNKRLLSISTTTKEDWQLLEARYLLRLANQRLMTERDSAGSIAQLKAADNILRDLTDVALFPVRKAIAADIAALTLSPNVDRDGVYLRLAALSDNFKQLPVLDQLPKSKASVVRSMEASVAIEDSPVDLVGWRLWLNNLWFDVKVEVKRRFDTKPVPNSFYVPNQETHVYLIERMRLKLEIAQLSLLNEKQQQYEMSLVAVIEILQQYYLFSEISAVFIGELTEIKAIEIRRELPDISASLAQLDAFIERLHKLENVGVEPLPTRVESSAVDIVTEDI